DRPRRARRAAAHRLRVGGTWIERRHLQAVIGLADELLVERGALERRLDQLAPLRLARRREFSGEGQRLIRHSDKLARKPPGCHALRKAGHPLAPAGISGKNRPIGSSVLADDDASYLGGSFSMPTRSAAAAASPTLRPAIT